MVLCLLFVWISRAGQLSAFVLSYRLSWMASSIWWLFFFLINVCLFNSYLLRVSLPDSAFFLLTPSSDMLRGCNFRFLSVLPTVACFLSKLFSYIWVYSFLPVSSIALLFTHPSLLLHASSPSLKALFISALSWLVVFSQMFSIFMT